MRHDRAVLGIDPGMDHTGIVLRFNDEYLDHLIITRDKKDDLLLGPDPSRYIAEVKEGIRSLRFSRHVLGDRAPVIVAVEGVKRMKSFIKGQQRIIDPTPLMGTAGILVMVRGLYPQAVVVPPGKNGSGILSSYPEQLVSPRERSHGLLREAPQSSDLRHARSAWDVAGSAPTIIRRRLAVAPRA